MRAWSDERVELLNRYSAEGLSASDIAERLGVTRNVVCGKAHRLGLTLRGVPGPKGSPRPWRRKSNNPFGANPSPRQKRAPGETQAHATPQGLDHSQPRDITPIASDPPEHERVDLLDLKHGQCKWPLGYPATFCGRKTCSRGSGSYCSDHAARAFAGTGRKPEREAA